MCLLHKAPSKTCCLLSPGRSSEETGYYQWAIVKKKKKNLSLWMCANTSSFWAVHWCKCSYSRF